MDIVVELISPARGWEAHVAVFQFREGLVEVGVVLGRRLLLLLVTVVVA